MASRNEQRNEHGDHSPLYEEIHPFGVLPDGTSSTDDPLEAIRRFSDSILQVNQHSMVLLFRRKFTLEGCH
jgi:hypothetical protein